MTDSKFFKINDKPYEVLLECMTGSHAYNLNDEDSDEDVQGIFFVPPNEYVSLYPVPPIQHVSSTKELDVTYFSLRRFLELIGTANPNFIELLWTPEDCMRHEHPVMELIKAQRETFLTQKVFYTYGSYALAQIKKAKSQNKWVSNPKPKEIPKLVDFCKFIQIDEPNNFDSKLKPVEFDAVATSKAFFKGRPEPLRFNLDEFHVSRVEGGHNLYRLYHYGNKSKGVIHNGEVVCQSIPKEDEIQLFMGLLIVNDDGFKKAKKDWKNYWDWKNNRNEARWAPKDAKEQEINYKNMSHCVRLLYSAINIFENGEPIVRLDDETRKTVLDIKRGRWYYDDILKLVNELEVKFNDAFEVVKEQKLLPHSLDMNKVDKLFIDCIYYMDEIENLYGAYEHEC